MCKRELRIPPCKMWAASRAASDVLHRRRPWYRSLFTWRKTKYLRGHRDPGSGHWPTGGGTVGTKADNTHTHTHVRTHTQTPPGDLLSQGSRIGGVELDAQTHGEGGLSWGQSLCLWLNLFDVFDCKMKSHTHISSVWRWTSWTPASAEKERSHHCERDGWTNPWLQVIWVAAVSSLIR